MKYQYSAADKSGEIKKGVIQASSLKEAKLILKKKNLLIINIEKSDANKLNISGVRKSFFSFGRVSVVEKVLFSKNLSVMLKSGLALKEALDILHDQAKGKLKKVLRDVNGEINAGKNLSIALSKHPKVFPQYYINIIKAAEESGTLEKNTEYLAEQMEKDFQLRRKVKGAMLYPVFILSATGVIGFCLAIFVLPKVTKLFKSFTLELPLSTRILIAGSEFIQNYNWQIIIIMIAAIFFFIWLFRLKMIKHITHPLILHVPVVGKIIQNINLARFCRTLGVLLKSGVIVDEALAITVATLSNYTYRKRIKQATELVKKGQALSQILDEHQKQFPKLATRMIKVGEESGELDDTLLYIATYYEGEIDNTTKNLTTIIEPVMLLIIGLLAGGLALSIITPIYKISGSLRAY